MHLRCVRCRQIIQPDDRMVCVFVSLPSFVYSTFAEQFEVTPGRWHWRCAPTIVRQYAPAVIVEEMKAEVARNLPKLVLTPPRSSSGS